MSTEQTEGNGEHPPTKEEEEERGVNQAYVPVSRYVYTCVSDNYEDNRLRESHLQCQGPIPTEVAAIAVAPTVVNYDATAYKDFPADLPDVSVGGRLEQVS